MVAGSWCADRFAAELLGSPSLRGQAPCVGPSGRGACPGQKRRIALAQAAIMTQVWRLVTLAALLGTQLSPQPTQQPKRQPQSLNGIKWSRIEWYTWQSGPPSLKSWPSSCAGHIWNDPCDRVTPRPSKWRPRCGNIGNDTGGTPLGTCRPMFVQRYQESPARTWSTWWQRCAAPWTASRRSMTCAGLWAWRLSLGTSCQTARLLCSECNRPSTPAGGKRSEQARPVSWPRLLQNWRTMHSTSWRSGCSGPCCPATSISRCSSGFTDMPAIRGLLVQPPPPRAHDPRLAWIRIDRRRLWRCWRFKTGTLRRLTARRRRLRGRHYEAPPRRLLLRLRGLLSAHTELYRGLFLLVLSCIGCVGRQHIKPLLSAPTPHPPQQSSHPGPKSRGSTSALNLQRYVLLLVIFLFLRTAQAGHGSADARVGGNPRQEPPEADQLGFRCFSSKANSNGVPQFSARHPKPVRKRAFMRAQRRAVLHGQAKYRGQWWSAQDLGCEAGLVRSMPQQPHAAPKPEPRIKFLSWNAGGLPSERNLELQAWLRSPEGQDVQIAVVQETHWRGPLEYRTDRFFAVHSGSTKSEAGLLVLVDKQAFAESTIQHREIIPGRLLHVRVETSPCLDLVVGYQHAWSLPRANVAATAAKDAVLAKRAEFWAQLTTLLSALPVRNRVLFLGDLNTTFGTEGSSVGRGILTRQGSHAPDTPIAQDMLRSLDLVVLNSWGPVGLRACTFVPASKRGHSQIDFAIMRKPEADALARCTAPKLLPFVPRTGMRHLPLLGSIPMPRKPITKAGPNPISRRKVQELCRIHPQLPDTFQLAVANIHASAPALAATELLTQAWQHATSSLPNQLPVQAQRTDYRPVLKLWRLRQTVRDLLPEARHSARVMFRLWQCRAALQAHQRELRRLCRANKRLKFDQMLQAAAATAPGLQRVHQVLRVFAPKAPRRKLQLRASNGMPLCIAETVEAISVYYTDLFGRTVLSCSLPAPTTPLQITTAEFQCALQGLPGNKALPPSVSPAALWTLAADTLAAKLLPQVNHWLRHMHLPPPDDWRIADICLLPKPNKPVAGPETLRPISLLHPVAKALAVVINDRLRPQLQTLVQELPQFSYLEGRSVQDALDRAMAHCSHVRSILHAQRQNPHLKRQGHAPAACRGGVTLSLDLQQAFDLMPRDSLLSAMQLANLDYSIQYAVLQLHSHAHMRFAHGGCTATVRTTNGVRQGCGLAPSLWCLFTCLVLTHIQKEISREATTVYADDFLFQWTVESPQHFEQIVAQIGYILRTLDSFGMRVSPTKTVLLVSLKGPLAGSTLRPHVRKLPGKGRHLRIPLQTSKRSSSCFCLW